MFGFVLAACVLPAASVERDPTPLGVPFSRYTTMDALCRKITFYLSLDGAAPIAVLVQGSGCDSVWISQGQRIYGSYQNVLRVAAAGRARVLIVEKPGVSFLDRSEMPGSATGCSAAFLQEHTLDRWATAVSAAIDGVLSISSAAAPVLVAGHSEGGIVAARVAAINKKVGHVAVLASGGPSQLFQRVEDARQAAGNEAAEDIYKAWAAIQADAGSVTRFFEGHPYRRWSSFLATSTTQELLKTNAAIYAAAGTLDSVVPIVELDVLRAELVAQGRTPVVERIEGADHGMNQAGQSGSAGRNVCGIRPGSGLVFESQMKDRLNTRAYRLWPDRRPPSALLAASYYRAYASGRRLTGRPGVIAKHYSKREPAGAAIGVGRPACLLVT